jgi:hypothetical protein
LLKIPSLNNNDMKTKLSIIVLFVALLGCKKTANVNVGLTGALTDCAANSTCTYNYYDNANFTNWNQPVSGNYRVFWYKSVNSNLCDETSQFYFKTSMNNDDFDISSNQIVAGQVMAYDMACPCCDVAFATKPIGGEIKGKRTDATHWLVNATIIFGTTSGAPIDTLTVNQYFTLAKVQ